MLQNILPALFLTKRNVPKSKSDLQSIDNLDRETLQLSEKLFFQVVCLYRLAKLDFQYGLEIRQLLKI
ncbi:hypothetical protein D3C73_1277610 [compost metagenome]